MNVPSSVLPDDPETVGIERHPVFFDFVAELTRIVQTTAENVIPACIEPVLRGVVRLPGLLTAAETAAPGRGYARHDIYFCPEGGFSVQAMVWSPGAASPVHDHREWCAFGVYHGCLHETRYVPDGCDATGPAARVARRLVHGAGAAAHLPVVAPNIHRMHNAGRSPAVSLHVYGGDCRRRGPNVGRVYRVKG